MIGVIFFCMVLCYPFFLVGDRLHLDVTGHQVLWLPGRPGVLEGPRRALRLLGSSTGRFWDLLGWSGGVPGRRPIITFRRQIRYKYWGFAAWAIFSDLWGHRDFLCFFNVFPSVVFVEWGGEFIVKRWKLKFLRLGSYVKFKKIMMKKLVSAGELWGPHITKII